MARKVLLVLIAGLLGAPPAGAQRATPGQVAYVEGVRAFDAGDYETAATRMRVALAEDPREATERFRYRAQNAEDYFPHLWLGLSLEKMGDRDGALEALRESRRQGAVDARPALRRILTSALARLTPPTPTPTSTPTRGPTAVPVLSKSPSPTARPALPEPPGAAPAAPAPTAAAAPAVRPVRPSPIPVPAGAISAGTSPAAIHAGLRAFFRGDYAGAEKLLSPEAGRSPVARVFLAWSLGGRYLLEEPRDPELLSRARAEYEAAVLSGAPGTGEPWVSPAILALFGAKDGPR